MLSIMNYKFFLVLAIVIFAGSFAGAVMKIMHMSGAEFLLALGLIGGLLFAVLALTEILPAPIQKTEKVMWVIGFIFLNWITVILYLAVGRNRILKNSNKNLSA